MPQLCHSVYCLEFDSSRIITGSRDRTIKVWSLKTGRCLATFAGHRGSVLCLKFDRDWDILDDDSMDVESGIDLAPGSSVGFAYDSDLYISVLEGFDAEVSTYIPVELGFATAGLAKMSVLTVPAVGYYEGITARP